MICIKHFKEKFIIRGKNLMWSLNPIPTINTEHTLKRLSTLPTLIIPREAPKVSVFQKDQSGEFFLIIIISILLKSSVVKNVLKALAA